MWLVRNIGAVATDDNNIISFPDSGDGDPVAAGSHVNPGAGGTNTNVAAGTTSLDTAFAAAGKMKVRLGGVDQYIYTFLRT